MHTHPIYKAMGLEGKRVLILHHDDLGSLHATNQAYFDIGYPTGSLMMPTMWVNEFTTPALTVDAAQLDLGVHLTLTSEWQTPRWRPLTNGATLRDEQGYFWATTQDCWQHVDVGEVEAEFRAQIEAALRMGVDVTHLDTHMGTVLRPDIAQVYARLAIEYRIPAFIVDNLEKATWMPAEWLEIHERLNHESGLPQQRWVDGYSVDPSQRSQWFIDTLSPLGPGVYHCLHHASIPTPESQMLPDWRWREGDWLALKDAEVRRVIGEFVLITYRDLRDAMRMGGR